MNGSEPPAVSDRAAAMREAARTMVDHRDVFGPSIQLYAHLGGWTVARQHGVSTAVNDAIVDAALDNVYALLAKYATEPEEE